MNVLLCRPQGSLLCARASAGDNSGSSADSEKTRKPQSVKPSLVASPSPVLSHAVDEKHEEGESPPSASTSFSKSLPLPLPIHLTLPSLPHKSVLPSPLKFLWFHRENSLEKDISEEKKDEPNNADPLSLTSAPRLGDVEPTSEGVESGTDDTQPHKLEEESTSGVTDKLRSWVPNLVNLAYLQSKYGFGFPRSGGEEADHQVRVPGLCHECECDTCGGDHYLQSEAKLKKYVMRFEVPVVHDKDTFKEYLHRVQYSDLQFIAHMAFLANQAYYIPEIKTDELLKHHGLRFVTSSLERKAVLAAKEKALLEAKEKSSGSNDAISTVKAEAQENDSNGAEVKTEDGKLGPAKSTYAMAATAASYLAFQTKSFLPFKSSAPDQNAPKEEEDDIAVASDDDEEEFFRYLELEAYIDEKSEENAKLPTDEEVLSEEKSKVSSPEGKQALEEASSMKPENQVTSGIAPVAGAAAASRLMASDDETKDAVAEELQSDAVCPSEWFVCDEEDTNTRYFVIQGSDSLASWQANLLFESSLFEDPEWGVMVHRGFYEAAKGLYEQLMPLIQAHVDRHGDKAKFYFTGHSLGGSLSTLLTLMLRHRGVLPLSALLPVYTFGSPSIMCGGDWLLEKLGFPLNHIRSVVMHYDIVPRSFACHYPDQIVEVLKRLNGTFRKHACLEQQKLMYATMGKMLIVQPDQQQAPHHPLLPPGGALYEVRHPKHDIYQDTLKDPHSQTMAMAKEVRSAERSFLNTPHPLEILIDPASYGSEGTISRDHDCASYVRAVNTALKKEFRKWRRLDRDQKRIRTPLKRSKSGKRYSRPGKDTKSSVENGPIAADSNKLQRSRSFSELEENASRRDIASDSQMEPLSR
ncbi:hypothetical protein KC19_5G083600 [Ceratodon purpureus]|uniref:Fungal lipase-type domain-containing protein n=1 Tax=Ceratodon purpureus TaxID=3225 RepID=A0A8T0I1D5_CERPU|nr:hypothetical protein KC19_5G083600 [Ceratodon purpureus]